MSFFKKLTENSKQDLIVLKATKLIDQQDLVLPEWQFLKSEYDSNQNSSWETKALISLVNSAFFQKRAFFVLAKRAFRELCQSDKNWNKTIGLKDKNWANFIHTATTSKLIQKVHASANGRYVFQLVHPELLSLMTIDLDTQKDEAIEFSERSKITQGTSKGTTLGNQEIETEKELEPDSTAGFGVPGKEWEIHCQTNSSPSPTAASPAPRDIILAWRASYPNTLDFLKANNATESLSTLVSTFKSYGYQSSDIPVREMTDICFRNASSPKVRAWASQTEARLKDEIKVQYANVQIAQSFGQTGSDALGLTPEERVYYDRFVAEGKTPSDFNGISLVEYARMRAHVDSFPTYNPKKD